jgi:hypothetical protein
MKNTRLAEIMVDPASCSGDEAREIIGLTRQFPYSAVLHILKAKIASDKKSPDKDKFLTRAAIISADRSQLRQYLTTNNIFTGYELVKEPVEIEEVKIIPEEEKKIEEHVNPVSQEIKPVQDIIPEIIAPVNLDEIRVEPLQMLPTGHKLVEELLENIAIYRTLIEKFDFLVSEMISSSSRTDSAENPVMNDSNEEKSDDNSRPARKRKSSAKLAKEEQDQLITRFIEAESDLKKSVKSAAREKKTKEDLSQDSSEFSDETVSETLAGIMISQGKLEKAIDIYRKLIWKLPQKKAYFASQIEILKEKISKQ